MMGLSCGANGCQLRHSQKLDNRALLYILVYFSINFNHFVIQTSNNHIHLLSV